VPKLRRANVAPRHVDYLGENGRDPTAFQSALRLETERVAMMAAHLGGGAACVGSLTSGGIESCMLAVKAARDAWLQALGGDGTPEIVHPITAHAAFHTAAQLMRVGVVDVDVDPERYRADPAAVAAAISERTCLIVGSAPGYAHGVVDPIAALTTRFR
jgi:glutamate/tyrosine decarboxylase-like PLP-dependent enzyme